jgi:APA family basic amino acid/polyamine antiporter
MRVARLGIFLLHFTVKTPATKQAVSTWPAAALVVSNMIGTGVFTALSFQIAGFSPKGVSLLSDSVFPLIMLWVVGGVLALCGALCYAELATALPRSGGEYHFLSRIYHPAVGFCAGFTSVTIGFAAPIAISAQAFGQYICQAFPVLSRAMPGNGEHMMTFLLVAGATAAHLRSLRFTGAFQAAATTMTILLLISFIIFGFGTATPQPIIFRPHVTDWSLLLSASFGSSLIWVMYSYSGWNAASYIVEEVRNPARALPRALILGTGFVILLYVAVNAVFLYSTPLSALANPKLIVAHIAGTHIFGAAGARITSGLICAGLIANVSGMMWVGSRVTEAMGMTYPKLGFFGRTSETRVPYVALLYQGAVVFTLLFFKPNDVVNYVGAVLWFWSLLAVLGVFVLRIREPDLRRPYRTFGYPVTPVIFGTVTVFCLIQNYDYHPTQTLIGAATVLLGIPIYLWVSRNVPVEQLRGEMLPESSV